MDCRNGGVIGRKRYTVEQIIHLNGSCKLNVMKGGHVILKAEVSLEEVHTLVVKNEEGGKEDGVCLDTRGAKGHVLLWTR